MRQLPPLEVIENCSQYVVAVDNIIDHRSEREIFVFCVMGYTDNEFHVIHSATLINPYSGRVNSPYREYCKQLSKHYNVEVMFETNK
jgi:hypothetical protein